MTDRVADKRPRPSGCRAARRRVPENDPGIRRQARLARRPVRRGDGPVGSSADPIRHNSTARPQKRPPLLPRSALLVPQTTGAASPRRGTPSLSHSILLRFAAALPRPATQSATLVAPPRPPLLATPARSSPLSVRWSLLQTDRGCS